MRLAQYLLTLVSKHKKGWGRLFLVALALILFSSPQSVAQSVLGDISIEKGGQVWIEGSAGIINYKCRAAELSGNGKIENTTNPKSTVQGEGDVQISVLLPVKALDCGKRAMNKDMYEALKSENYPTIRYQLLDARLSEKHPAAASEWMKIRTRGIMEIAGVEDTTTIWVEGKILSQQRFQVKGCKQIHMNTYHIDPPRAMFGLIKADEKLTVHFDVTVNLDDTGK